MKIDKISIDGKKQSIEVKLQDRRLKFIHKKVQVMQDILVRKHLYL